MGIYAREKTVNLFQKWGLATKGTKGTKRTEKSRLSFVRFVPFCGLYFDASFRRRRAEKRFDRVTHNPIATVPPQTATASRND